MGGSFALHLERIERLTLLGLCGADPDEKAALLSAGSISDGIDMRLALGQLALRSGDYATALRLGKTMTTLLQPSDRDRRARALLLQAMARWHAGELTDSVALHTRAIDLAERPTTRARALDGRGFVRGYLGGPKDAIVDHEAALALADADPIVLGEVHNHLGFALTALSRFDEALLHLHSAVALQERTGDHFGLGITLNNIGHAQRLVGSPLAGATLDRALVKCRDTGNRLYEAVVLNNQGQLTGMKELFEQALKIARELGDKIREADNLGSLGAALLDEGDRAAAKDVLIAAVAMRRSARDLAFLTADLAALAEATAPAPEARDLIDEAEELLATVSGIEQPEQVRSRLSRALHALSR